MNQQRFLRIRNIQSVGWYESLVMRPLTIGLLLIAADWKILTPNRATTISNIFKFAAALLILPSEHTCYWLAIILAQVGALFDHVDGQLARYRRTWSALGSFYDKVGDIVTWSALTFAVAWSAFKQTGHGSILLIAGVSTTAFALMGYMKWVYEAEAVRLEWFRVSENLELVQEKIRPPKLSLPPQRSRSDWMKWIAGNLARIVRVSEIDLFFWLGVFLYLGRLEWCIWFFGITQLIDCGVMAIKRGLAVHRLDQDLAPYRAQW